MVQRKGHHAPATGFALFQPSGACCAGTGAMERTEMPILQCGGMGIVDGLGYLLKISPRLLGLSQL